MAGFEEGLGFRFTVWQFGQLDRLDRLDRLRNLLSLQGVYRVSTTLSTGRKLSNFKHFTDLQIS